MGLPNRDIHDYCHDFVVICSNFNGLSLFFQRFCGRGRPEIVTLTTRLWTVERSGMVRPDQLRRRTIYGVTSLLNIRPDIRGTMDALVDGL